MLATHSPKDAIEYSTFRMMQQGGPSIMKNNGFGYRGTSPNGNPASCGVGWLILSNEYHPSMEGYSIAHIMGSILFRSNPAIIRLNEYPHGLLMDIQRAHDSASFEWNKGTVLHWQTIIRSKMMDIFNQYKGTNW